MRRVAADNVSYWSEWATTIEMQTELISILKSFTLDEQVMHCYVMIDYINHNNHRVFDIVLIVDD